MAGPAPAQPSAGPRRFYGWSVSVLAWLIYLSALAGVLVLTTGPIAYLAHELSPPATGSIWDDVIPAAVRGGLVCGVAGAVLVLTRIIGKFGTRLRTRLAEHKLADDVRPPVLYLRSFGDERGRPGTAEDEEISLASVLSDIGPVIAIGRPGERLPRLGAARLYLDEDQWQPRVRELMSRAALIVLRTGTSDGVIWELRQAFERISPSRFIIAVPLGGPKQNRADRWQQFCNAAAGVFPHPLPSLASGGVFVVFSSDWEPRLLTHRDAAGGGLGQDRIVIRKLLRPVCEAAGLRLRKHGISDVSPEMLAFVLLIIQMTAISQWRAPLFWRDLVSAEGQFSVTVPGRFYEQTHSVRVNDAELTTREYIALRRDHRLECRASYMDLASSRVVFSLDGARDGLVRHLQGTLIAEVPYQSGPWPGTDLQIRLANGESIVRVRIVSTPKRAHTLIAAVPADGSEDRAAARFLDSFRLAY